MSEPASGQRWSTERRDLICEVFAEATSLIERAHADALSGQSSKLDVAAYHQRAGRLGEAARDLVTLAAALPILMDPWADVADGSEEASSDAPT